MCGPSCQLPGYQAQTETSQYLLDGMPASTDEAVGEGLARAGTDTEETEDKAKLMTQMTQLSQPEVAVGKLVQVKDYVATIGLFNTVQWVFVRQTEAIS